LTEAFESHDAEVSIAVRVATEEGAAKSTEDAEVASDFFSNHGFELVHITSEGGEVDSNGQDIDPYGEIFFQPVH
jgi:hypothetical protein